MARKSTPPSKRTTAGKKGPKAAKAVKKAARKTSAKKAAKKASKKAPAKKAAPRKAMKKAAPKKASKKAPAKKAAPRKAASSSAKAPVGKGGKAQVKKAGLGKVTPSAAKAAAGKGKKAPVKKASVKKTASKPAATKAAKKASGPTRKVNSGTVRSSKSTKPGRADKGKKAGTVRKAAPPVAPTVGSPEGPAARPRKEKTTLKQRYQMEFMVRSAPNVLYELISTPSGFSEWYCDDVNVKGARYTFIWDGEEETAQLIGQKRGELVRFQWEDDEDPNAFFELRIRIDAMTNDVALILTDHAWPHELETARALWDSQIHNLLRVIGA